MLGLPRTTDFDKRIPKEKFYTVGDFTSKDKNSFVNDIDRIIWTNKISEDTTNLQKGTNIEEIEILKIVLKKKTYNPNILNIIRKLIPYHILFVIEYDNESKLALYQTKLIETEWISNDNISIDLNGLNLDIVWGNFVKQIEGGNWDSSLSLDENIQKHILSERLQKEIAKLEKQARAEKQPKRKFELVQRIKELKERTFE